MHPILTWQGSPPGLRNTLYLIGVVLLVMMPVVISELLYAALN